MLLIKWKELKVKLELMKASTTVLKKKKLKLSKLPTKEWLKFILKKLPKQMKLHKKFKKPKLKARRPKLKLEKKNQRLLPMLLRRTPIML